MNDSQNRRQWMQSIVRWALVTGVGIVTGILTRRRLVAGCSQTLSTCRECMQLASCRLPAAKDHRDAGGLKHVE